MNLRRMPIGFAGLLLPLLAACNGHKVERVVVYENNVHHWRIEHVVAQNWPVGPRQYYEVFLKDRLLILPANVFNDERDISEFVAAGGFDISNWRNDTVIVAFENVQKREGGNEHFIRSLMITPEYKEGEVILTDMATHMQIVVQRVEPVGEGK
ncbi:MULTISPECIES: hypothetical protein [Pseudomonas]|uniref:hypothetical protein n=1 Tax=Pseudomonas TaxID=286 RepID=UPI000A1E40E0|nr:MULTISPECIES: hypothetical protein [Pseudomonas]CAB5648663.1 Uncharacterised protein [Pseudomonas putida]GJB85118.1 hypothetical protein KAM380_095830 [Aeromonas caviae]MBO2925229.1 hypothetical protein [Pseudomonas asiatica]MCO7523879.1 hypothetical protein [Pseudomonas asiatica]MDH4432999.1 hypothetical protein [Pseudomonas shirazica]